MTGWTYGRANHNSTTLIDIGNRSTGITPRLINSNNFEFVISTNGQADTPQWIPLTSVPIERRPYFEANIMNVKEVVINTNGQADDPQWIKVVHEDIEINTTGEEWKINITSETGGIDMPVELSGLREHNILEERASFNVSQNVHTGPVTSNQTEVNIPVIEDMVVSGNWRTPHTGYVILSKLFDFNVKNYMGTGLMSSKHLIVNIPVSERLVSDDRWRIPWQSSGSYKINGLVDADSKVLIIDENTWQVVKAQDVTPDTYEVTGLDDGKKLAVARRNSDGMSIAYGDVDPVPE